MKRAIISGAAGFIGQALTKALLACGVEVYGLCATPEKLGDVRSDPAFHMVPAEFTEYSQLAEKITERGFDVFFHLAWQGYGKATNDWRVQLPNVQYACDAACTAAELKCRRFVFADSSHEYLKSQDSSGVSAECSIYGTAKKAARQMSHAILHTRGVEFVGVLFTNVFGPGDCSSRSVNAMLTRLMNGEDLNLIKGEHLYDWTYIDDCIGGVLAAARSGKNHRVYYVGSRHLRPFCEIITEVRDIVSPGSKLFFGRYQDSAFIDYREIDTYALYRDTGFLPSAVFKESVEKTVAWLKEHPMSS